MIIVFKEEDRARIEAQGMTVIEAKSVCYKVIKVLQQVVNSVVDICKNMTKEQIVEFLREMDEGE